MIYSMTGYAVKSQEILKDTVTIEIRCLNSKMFDFSLKCPEVFFLLENQIKKLAKKNLKRGKVEIKIKKSNNSQSSEKLDLVEINKKMAYLKKISPKSSNEKLLELSLLIPKSNQQRSHRISRNYQQKFLKLVISVIKEVVSYRANEGESLKKELINYVNQISTQLSKIIRRDKKRIENKRAKIKTKFKSIIKTYDKIRLEEEVIYYLEKMDISEEIARLKHHIKFFLQIMNSNKELGKKINFLTQEMLRETNTIGSKSNDFELQKSVVEIKEKLENIKEQIQNVL